MPYFIPFFGEIVKAVKEWGPCAEKWAYEPRFGACYNALPKWKLYNWMEANMECKGSDPQSSLLFLDEVGEDEFIYKFYWQNDQIWSWIGAKYSSGIAQLILSNSHIY